MKKNLKDNSFKELYDFFAKEPTLNQKAWGIIHDFYHLVLTRMKKNGITKADLARQLNKSRAAISQMFNKNPNVSIRKIVEIADAVGLEICIQATAHKVEAVKPQYSFSFTDNVVKVSSIYINDVPTHGIALTNEAFHLSSLTVQDSLREFPVHAQA